MFAEVRVRSRLVRFLALTLALIGVPATGSADELRQERLFAIVPVGPDAGINVRKIVEIDTRTSNLGAVVGEWPLTVEPPDSYSGRLHVVGAGRYLVWLSGLPVLSFLPRAIRLNVFDTLSGAVRSFDIAVNGPILAVDNVGERLFFSEPGEIAVLDARTGNISRLAKSPEDAAWNALLPPPAAYAADIDRLFVRRSLDWQVVDSFDVSSGRLVQTMSVESTATESNAVLGLATDQAGTRLYLVQLGFAGTAAVSVYDTGTRRLVARTSLLVSDTRDDYRVQFDAERRRLLVGSLVVFDADTLTRLGSVQGVCSSPQCQLRGPSFTFIGPRSPLLFFISQAALDYAAHTRGCAAAPLEARDPATGQLQGVADLSLLATRTAFEYGGCVIQMAMATVPPAPRAFTSSVQGHRVTLAWTDPGNTTHFQIEAGSASRLANLYNQAVSGSTLVVDEVPPGIYYVRIRAVNYVGRSEPVEIPVVVP